ncbi:Transcription factor IIIC, subunit 5 [Arabidopsis thaliana]|uniref:Transcription factor IIIC, subunit 5 n=2 Tax=Arabidopsis thaliana TaxID=3702 RepID=F4IXX4_ARATH|nr:Transcription factor IIIC, subunit 5 [Arabidopsis thaliana]NP_190510.3 Transcription factor IIIC, subunit 5 [Arabidopsis thaliana]AEE78539.1 Transcription factor IIIC, subunit 5 [Arabidopsis thaliana]ANM63682.1 Transcription factor IIIC, subunit 5 [Arabidopsis thaliana]|eukprot:NP_001325756.1 Transcription factor IIIC, subunit 5 [Arabidopsis thaliana]
MGIIEEGTISGTLPSKEAFVVHFPGYPSSISRAIETLGGIQGITQARESISNKLELRFRPEDPYAHPALGEQRPCSGFLLRISKQDIKKPESQSVLDTSRDVCLEEASPVLCADIVARLSESFHFDGMADYQHVIPIHADIAQQKKRKWMDVDPLTGKSDLMGLADEDVMMLLPQFFAPKDIPDNVALKPPATSGPKKKDDAATQNFYEIDVGPVFAIDFSVKEIPKKLKWEDFVSRSSNHWQWQVAVSALFEERPIWTRDSVVQRLLDKGLKCTHHMLNRFLLRAAYYFSSGPFLRFWIKRGYDPRNDPESRVYQRMEFRVPPELRGYCDANATNNSKPSWNDICAFKLFPFKCQTFLQLFELDDEYIQREIRKPPKQTTCSHKSGWFSEAMLDTLRLRVAVRFVSVFPETGFEDVFKSIQEEFERSEKVQIQKETLKPSLVKHREATKGSEDMETFKSVNENVDANVNEDGEDENLDDEDEDEEEEEELDMAAGDNEISLDSHGYLDTENSSRTYLQGLFDSFPSSEPNLYGDFAVDDGSDGEFQIYEEESEGLYSIDDDHNDDDEEEDDDD